MRQPAMWLGCGSLSTHRSHRSTPPSSTGCRPSIFGWCISSVIRAPPFTRTSDGTRSDTARHSSYLSGGCARTPQSRSSAVQAFLTPGFDTRNSSRILPRRSVTLSDALGLPHSRLPIEGKVARLSKKHIVSGNRASGEVGAITLRNDSEWRSGLPPRMQAIARAHDVAAAPPLRLRRLVIVGLSLLAAGSRLNAELTPPGGAMRRPSRPPRAPTRRRRRAGRFGRAP